MFSARSTVFLTISYCTKNLFSTKIESDSFPAQGAQRHEYPSCPHDPRHRPRGQLHRRHVFLFHARTEGIESIYDLHTAYLLVHKLTYIISSFMPDSQSPSTFLVQKSGQWPLPLPNCFTSSSYSVLVVRVFTQFPIKKKKDLHLSSQIQILLKSLVMLLCSCHALQA